MTSVPRRVATFAGVVVLLYAGGFAAGNVIDAEPPAHGDEAPAAHGTEESRPAHAGQEEPADAEPVAHGLSTTANGLRLAVEASEVRAGRPHDIAFAVLDETGAPLTEYDTTHTKKMHLIIVRRDTTGFQHLHPSQDGSGLWRARTTIEDPGAYRLFADFSHEGRKTTLAGDLRVDGPADYRPLPKPAPLASAGDGYQVRIDADEATAGEEAQLAFSVLEDGREADTEPYLGAGGHLVALREGDLGFLHVHPTERPGAIAFAAAFPSAGRYRLFLQFKAEGRVRTAAFTHEVR